MPRVLLLCEFPELNGAERSLLACLEQFHPREFSFLAASPSAGPLAESLTAQGIEVLSLAWRDEAGQSLSLSRRREELAAIIARVRPDLLHANSISMGRVSGPVTSSLGLPSLAHLRDIVGLSRQAVADLNRHRRLLAVSEATRAYHVRQGLAAERTAVVYNGVDLKRFHPRAPTGFLHDELRLPRSARLVATIGQIGLRKGQDVLLRAANMLAESQPDVHYLLIGRRCSQKEESRRFEDDLLTAASGPLAGRVHFLGVRGDVERILNELVLLVHPARQEPLGRVLLEAAAAGLPVIATQVGGTPEIFPPHRDCARLIPSDDAGALAAALAELLSDDGGCRALGRAARQRAEEAFAAADSAAGLSRQYREALRL